MFAVSLPCINESLTGIAGISSSNCSWVFFIVAGDCKSEVLSDCKYQYMPPVMQTIKMITRIIPRETLFFSLLRFLVLLLFPLSSVLFKIRSNSYRFF